MNDIREHFRPVQQGNSDALFGPYEIPLAPDLPDDVAKTVIDCLKEELQEKGLSVQIELINKPSPYDYKALSLTVQSLLLTKDTPLDLMERVRSTRSNTQFFQGIINQCCQTVHNDNPHIQLECDPYNNMLFNAAL